MITYDDVLHFLAALAVALFMIMVGVVIISDLFKPKKRCKNCKIYLNYHCRLIDWLSKDELDQLDELDENGNCLFYSKKD